MERDKERKQETVYGVRDYMIFKECTNIKECQEICKRSGSKRVRETAHYLSTAQWQGGEKFTAEIADNVGFYAGTFCKAHFNLVEIAVLEEKHGQGIGSRMLRRLKQRCLEKGIHIIRLRTSMEETAVDFYQKQGGKIVGYKENDFVMEIKI